MTFTPLPMPTIETERLVLRGWFPDDFPVIEELFGNEENARYIGGVKEPWEAWRHTAMFFGHYHMRGYTTFAVETKDTGDCIGCIGPWYPGYWPEPEIGYSLISGAQGKGYATEAAAASLSFAYTTLGWTTAISCIDARNEGSKSVARKLGATYEGAVDLFGHSAECWRHLPPTEFAERFA